MNLLILGGTVFLGRHLVEAALTRGHEVTLFNRGRSDPEAFPEVQKLRGNRDSDLTALEGRRWDAVIDTCAYLPRAARASAELLANAVDRYVFISTLGAYADFAKPGIGESAPVSALANENAEEITGETYGALKAMCERAVEDCMPGRVLSIRAGLIVGPHDPLDRFTYWARRVARGGEVLAPGRPDRRVQIIDARDLADWIVRSVESGRVGVYNSTGPDYALSMGRLLEECKAVSGSDARFVWVDDKFLQDKQVGAWNEVPLWLPEDNLQYAGFMSVDCSKAVASGLTFRPLTDTVGDTLAWDSTRSGEPVPYEVYGMSIPLAGLTPERELELLKAWRDRR